VAEEKWLEVHDFDEPGNDLQEDVFKMVGEAEDPNAPFYMRVDGELLFISNEPITDEDIEDYYNKEEELEEEGEE